MSAPTTRKTVKITKLKLFAIIATAVALGSIMIPLQSASAVTLNLKLSPNKVEQNKGLQAHLTISLAPGEDLPIDGSKIRIIIDGGTSAVQVFEVDNIRWKNLILNPGHTPFETEGFQCFCDIYGYSIEDPYSYSNLFGPSGYFFGDYYGFQGVGSTYGFNPTAYSALYGYGYALGVPGPFTIKYNIHLNNQEFNLPLGPHTMRAVLLTPTAPDDAFTSNLVTFEVVEPPDTTSTSTSSGGEDKGKGKGKK